MPNLQNITFMKPYQFQKLDLKRYLILCDLLNSNMCWHHLGRQMTLEDLWIYWPLHEQTFLIHEKCSMIPFMHLHKRDSKYHPSKDDSCVCT